MSGYDLMEALDAIDPSGLHYDDWLAVVQALHHEGYDEATARAWTSRDVRHDHEQRLEKLSYKWSTFGRNVGSPVTGGTIVKLAQERGWRGTWSDEHDKPHRALSWDSVIGGNVEDDPVLVDAASVGEYDADVHPMYPEGHEVEELQSFLSALFEPSERIGYVCDYEEEQRADGTVKYKPGSRGVYTRTMGDVYEAVGKSGLEGGLSSTLHDESGAWIRFNPLDGTGVGNANVTAHRFALLESDEMPQGKFAAIVKQLNLPVAAMVDSGNKSLHAIVRVDAEDAKQYRERVETLYARCEKNGIAVDKANKNASRMCRMPGVRRQGRRQFLACLNQGAGDWDEWCEWYEEATDELPDVVELTDMLGDNLPALKPALIEGMLRVGHKMLVSGPSKAGKSFALINLCIAFAEGLEWFGFKCRRSKVMYVNLELDEDSCFNRFNDMYEALGVSPTAGYIDVWNLRGKAQPMHKLLPKLVRRCLKHGTEVVVIDPIYKVITGDENSAGDMAAFANLFDELCDQAGVSAIYCHHHSKGSQADKRSIDRASGSGVFGRDPDAIIDMVELDADEGTKWKHVNDKICGMCEAAAVDMGCADAWAALPDVTRKVEANALPTVLEWMALGDMDEQAADLKAAAENAKASQGALTAWRIEGTLREFPHFRPVSAWFDWPLHVVDDALAECGEAGLEQPSGKGKGRGRRGWSEEDTKKAAEANRAKAEKAHKAIAEAFTAALRRCEELGNEPTVTNVYDCFPDIEGIEVTRSKVDEWSKDRNSSWCPVQKTKSVAGDKKSKLLTLVETPREQGEPINDVSVLPTLDDPGKTPLI